MKGRAWSERRKGRDPKKICAFASIAIRRGAVLHFSTLGGNWSRWRRLAAGYSVLLDLLRVFLAKNSLIK